MNMTIQPVRYHDGGFCLHKIELCAYRGHFSAWYEPDGSMLDAEERFPGRNGRRGRNVGVKRDGPAWRQLAALGPIWKNL